MGVVMQILKPLILLALIVLIFTSCSESSDIPVLPEDQSGSTLEEILDDARNHQGASNTPLMWGMWEIEFDLENQTAEVHFLRHASFTGNQNFHAPPGMITLDNIEINYDTGEIDADIGLEHSFPALKRYTGFDVMGVFMGDGNAVYPGDYDLAIHGADDQRLLNADGYTRWFNANEFKGVGEIPPMFGYNPGHMGTPGYKPTADLNGYKYYAVGLGALDDEFQFLIDNADDRGMFVEGDEVWRHYSMIFPELPQTLEAKFQYAIIGHWEPNKHDPGPPVDVPGDFPPEANVDEAVVCDIQNSSTAWWDSGEFGGNVILDISPWDWSATCDAGTMTEYVVKVYSEAWSGAYEVDTTCIGLTDFYETFHAEIPVETVDSCDPLEVWVEVRYPGMDYSNDFGAPNNVVGALAGYFLVTVPITCDAPMSVDVLTPNGGEEIWWSADYEITWTSQYLTGLVDIEYSKDDFVSDINTIAIDEEDNGTFMWLDVPIDISDTVKVRITSVDFPSVSDDSDEYFSIVDHGWARNWGVKAGWEVELDSSNNIYTPCTALVADTDEYLAKYTEYGEQVWQITFGGAGEVYAYGIDLDSSENVYVSGAFSGTVDFDPGSGTDWHTSSGNYDTFLCKISPSGSFEWAKSWGLGSTTPSLSSVAIDNDNIFVGGQFFGTQDFNPEAGFEYRISAGASDAFISKFDTSGNWQTVITYGGTGTDNINELATDGNGYLYPTGRFSTTVDFDPGPGEDIHVVAFWYDIYFGKYDLDLNHEWVISIGGTSTEIPFCISISDTGDIAVSGYFMETVDFDAGPGEDFHTANGILEAFLFKYNGVGEFQWAHSWGGDGYEYGEGVAFDSSGNVYGTGLFFSTVDFDPGSGINEHTAIGSCDSYLSKFSSDGTYQWTRVWGSTGSDVGQDVQVDQASNLYISGYIGGETDFGLTDPPCNQDSEVHTSTGSDAFLVRLMPDGCW